MDREDTESWDELAAWRRGHGQLPADSVHGGGTIGPALGESGRPDGPVRRAFVDVAVAVAFMGMVALLLLHPWQDAGTGSSPRARLALSTYQSYPSGPYRSGQTVRLAWNRMPHVAIYRVQIARAPAILLPATVMVTPWRTTLTDRTALRLTVQGPEIYYWRVQPYLAGAWGPWSAARVFGVARPLAPVPMSLTPISGSARRPGRVTLCWARVASAFAFRLQVDRSTRDVPGRCRSLAVQPGVHYWRVRALARGLGVFPGAPSHFTRLIVSRPAPPRASSKVARHHVRAPISSFPAIVPVLSAPSPPVLIMATAGDATPTHQRSRRTAGVKPRTRRVRTHAHRQDVARSARPTHRLVRPSGTLHLAGHHSPVESVHALASPTPRPTARTATSTALVPPPPEPTATPTPLGGSPPPPPPPPGG